MALLLKSKWSSVCLPLKDLFCNCITSLRNIETGRNASLGVLLVIWLPGSSLSVQKDSSKHYSQCRGCFPNTLAQTWKSRTPNLTFTYCRTCSQCHIGRSLSFVVLNIKDFWNIIEVYRQTRHPMPNDLPPPTYNDIIHTVDWVGVKRYTCYLHYNVYFQ